MAFWLDAAKDTYFAQVWEPRGGRSTLVEVNQLPQSKLPNFQTIQHQARPKYSQLLVLCPQQYSHEMVGYDVSPYFDLWNPQAQKNDGCASRRSFVMYPINLW